MGTAEKTEWKGLWQNREGVYSGQIIRKADIPNYVRLIVRYNKFYDKDSNKPRFVYCFANGDAAKAITIKTETADYVSVQEAEETAEELEELNDMRCFTDEQLQKLINRVACAAGGEGEYGEHIISDFVTGFGLSTHVY